MKLADVGGLGAAIFAGYYMGVKSASLTTFDFVNTATVTDWLIVGALLAVAFYLAVILS